MPVEKGKYYDLDKVQFIVDGDRITGFAGDGQIEVENLNASNQSDVGADGLVTRSRIIGWGVRFTVTLVETARAYAVLARKMQEMDEEDVPVDRAISLFDPLNGDEYSDSQMWFEDPPVMSKGATVGTRVFVIVAPNGRANAKYGSKLLE